MIVVDASVLVSRVVTIDAMHARSRTWVAATLAESEEIVVPNLLLGEVAGAVARRTRDAALARASVADLVAESFITVADTDALIDLIVDTAITASLRGADAVYVALARHLEVPLVTWDREIVRKAGRLIDVREPTLSAT